MLGNWLEREKTTRKVRAREARPDLSFQKLLEMRKKEGKSTGVRENEKECSLSPRSGLITRRKNELTSIQFAGNGTEGKISLFQK